MADAARRPAPSAAIVPVTVVPSGWFCWYVLFVMMLVYAFNIIGLGLGPYTVGSISDASGSLRTGIIAAICIVPVSLSALLITARRLAAAEAAVLARGDDVDAA